MSIKFNWINYSSTHILGLKCEEEVKVILLVSAVVLSSVFFDAVVVF